MRTEYQRAKQREASKRYRDTHKEKITAERPKYSEKHREAHRKWVDANREHVKEYKRELHKANPAPHRKESANYRAANPEKSKAAVRACGFKKYGMTPKDYDEMLARQDGGCALCHKKAPGGHGRFHVDHDHKTNVIRGLLCNNCNRGLGFFRDDPVLLAQAISYLAAPSTGFTFTGPSSRSASVPTPQPSP